MTIHLDDRDRERVRTTAYHLSQDLERSDRSNDVGNWVEAEALEEARLVALLDAYPRLRGVFTGGAPSLAVSHLGSLVRALRDEGVERDLAAVERALDGLLSRKPPVDLQTVSRDLAEYSDAMQSQTRWDRAAAELLGLDYLNRHGALLSLGWPPPPAARAFDCTLRVHDVTIPCDLKPGAAGGFLLVRERLKALVRGWTEQREIGPVDTLLSYRGSLPHPGGDALHAEADLAAFDALLRTHADVPAAPLGVRIGTTQFDLSICKQGTSGFVSALLPSFKKQLEQKAKLASEGGASCFMLGHVLLGSGEQDAPARQTFDELAKKTSAGATHLAHSAGSAWLGMLLFDHQRGDPKVTCYVRPAASWPANVTYKTLASTLEAGVIVL